MIAPIRNLIAELSGIDGKAEILNGEIVTFMPTGRKPAYAAFQIAVALHMYVRLRKLPGIAVPDNAGFQVHLPNRQTFSPNAAYYVGPNSGMKFFDGAPQFAVEVRSENDYGAVAEMEMREKRADYFAAGTLVVWDVDLLNEPVIRKFESPQADQPSAVYRRGEIADAGVAVPEWTFPVDDLFESQERN